MGPKKPVMETAGILVPAALFSEQGAVDSFMEQVLRENGWVQRGVIICQQIMEPRYDEDGFINGLSLSRVKLYTTQAVTDMQQFDDEPHRVVFNLTPLKTPTEGLYRDHTLKMKIYEYSD